MVAELVLACVVLEWAEMQMAQRVRLSFRSPWNGDCEGTASR